MVTNTVKVLVTLNRTVLKLCFNNAVMHPKDAVDKNLIGKQC